MTKDTGGPAFPSETGNIWYDKGMSLRDYFAAKAMQSYVAHNQAYDFDDIAAMAYRTADAMLKARQA